LIADLSQIADLNLTPCFHNLFRLHSDNCILPERLDWNGHEASSVVIITNDNVPSNGKGSNHQYQGNRLFARDIYIENSTVKQCL